MSSLPLIFEATDPTGAPLVGGKLYTYTDNTNTILKSTYTDSSGEFLASNPLILNTFGRVIVYAPSGNLYVNLTSSDDINILYSPSIISLL